MSFPTYTKDPSAVLDWSWDWSNWLADASDDVSSFSVTADNGLTVDSSAESEGVVTAWLSGGTAGSEYNVVCQVVTTGGRTDERTITIEVEQR